MPVRAYGETVRGHREARINVRVFSDTFDGDGEVIGVAHRRLPAVPSSIRDRKGGGTVGHCAAEMPAGQVGLGLALLRLFLLRPVRCPNPLCFATSARLAE